MKKILLLCLAVALSGCGAKEPTYQDKTLSTWKKDLKSPTGTQRREAAVALGIIAKAQPAIAHTIEPDLTAALADSDAPVRRSAAEALGKIGVAAKPAEPKLTAALADSDKEVRSNAALALAAVDPGSPEVVKALIGLLQDKEIDVRKSAVVALREMGPNGKVALDPLDKLMKEEKDPDLRSFVNETIRSIRSFR